MNDSYTRYLGLTGEPVSAAILTLAEVLGGSSATPPVMLTVAQASERLGVSPNLVYQLCSNGRLAHTKFGRSIRISPEALEGCLKKPAVPHLRCLR